MMTREIRACRAISIMGKSHGPIHHPIRPTRAGLLTLYVAARPRYDRLGRQTMTNPMEAIYENGVFRPLAPVSCHERERVLLTVESLGDAEENLLDHEFLAYCETQADDSVPLEAVRLALSKIPGSL